MICVHLSFMVGYPEERQDFDITPIVVTFDNDDFHQSEVNTPVTIYDDSRNEATEFFVVTLEVISALNPDKVIIQRHASLCRIADDDRELFPYLENTQCS